MPRYKMIIEYDGAPFSGWQVQANATLTVQGALERAAEAICGEPIRVHGAGRTDAGVHALGQVAHCDVPKVLVPGRFRDGMNAHLRPHPVGVLSADVVPDDFEARFSAIKRHYVYRITNRRANLAVDAGRVWRVPRPLDVAAMSEAAKRLLGRHDITTSARSFLHSQVRSMVGSLVWVGNGRWTPDDLAAALAAKDRSACGIVAPPDGLYLVKVDY